MRTGQFGIRDWIQNCKNLTQTGCLRSLSLSSVPDSQQAHHAFSFCLINSIYLRIAAYALSLM